MLADNLEVRGNALADVFRSKARWVQATWAFLCMVSVGAIFAQVWRMPFGHVLLAGAGFLAGVRITSRWRYGPVVFVSTAGAIWTIWARYPAAAILVTLAVLLWIAQFTLPFDPPVQDRDTMEQHQEVKSG
jgi:hypothetical protein